MTSERIYRGDIGLQSPKFDEGRTRSRFVSGLGSVSSTSERGPNGTECGSGSAERRDYDRHFDDGDRDESSRRLSLFNEGLSRGDSPSMKFQWKQLLSETPKLISNENQSTNRSTDCYGVSATRVSRLGTVYSDADRSGMFLDKPISVETERARIYSFCPSDVSFSKRSVHVDCGFTLPARNLNFGIVKDDGGGSRHHPDLDRPTKRKLYKEENSMICSKDTSDYMMSFSGSKAIVTESLRPSKEDFPGSFEKELRVPADGYRLSTEMITAPVGHDRYGRKSHIKSPANSDVPLNEMRDYPHTYLSPTEGKHGDYTYLEGQRSVRGNMGTKPKERQAKIVTVGEEYGHRDLSRTSLVDSIVDRIDEGSPRERLMEGKLWDHIPSSEGHFIPNYLDASGSLNPRKQDGEVLGYRSALLKYEKEVYQDHEGLLSEGHCYEKEVYQDHEGLLSEGHCYEKEVYQDHEGLLSERHCYEKEVYQDHEGLLSEGHRYDKEIYQDHEGLLLEGHGYERGGGPWSNDEISEVLPMTEYGPCLDAIDEHCLDLGESSRIIQKRKHAMDEKSSRQNVRSKFPSNGKSTCKINDQGVADEHWTGEDRDSFCLSKKLRFSRSQYAKTVRASNETVSMPSQLSKPHNSGGRDIKKRLGPAPQDIHVSNCSVKNDKALVKKRLGPGPQNIHASPVKNDNALVKKRFGPGPQNIHVSPPLSKSYKARKFQRKIQDGSYGGLHIQGVDPSEGSLTFAKAEPPENSEDFKQLVHSVFLRFIKQLNENSAQRRRFTEQGKAGGLKCSICGSNSEEFVDSKSLVMHAFTSPLVGFRSQHLGFHKALCVLMGWKSAMGPNNTWVCETLSDAETLALKEDLIIWPPVVIIHNSSIRNKNPDERVIVSIEVLETILKDMGFGGKTKVCRGKPANQSIMVVKFNSTFSGLQEAERLHKFYAETKRGRTEFHCINSTSSTAETPKASTDKMGLVLFAHLGLAEDMDKLDFETKKRCLVKSKKEIQDIAGAPLKTD